MAKMVAGLPEQTDFDFDGKTYEPEYDKVRLNKQASRVWMQVASGRWLTLREIEDATGDPQASISARLRDFRKDRFGGHSIERRRRGEAKQGLWEYRLIPSARPVQLELPQ